MDTLPLLLPLRQRRRHIDPAKPHISSSLHQQANPTHTVFSNEIGTHPNVFFALDASILPTRLSPPD